MTDKKSVDIIKESSRSRAEEWRFNEEKCSKNVKTRQINSEEHFAFRGDLQRLLGDVA